VTVWRNAQNEGYTVRAGSDETGFVPYPAGLPFLALWRLKQRVIALHKQASPIVRKEPTGSVVAVIDQSVTGFNLAPLKAMEHLPPVWEWGILERGNSTGGRTSRLRNTFRQTAIGWPQLK
jgi:hypothetical protein